VLLGAVTLALMAVDVPLEASIRTLSFGNDGLEFVFVAPFTLVGVVVAAREPLNPLGWLLQGIGLLTVLIQVASDYAVFVYHFGHRGSPLGPVAVLLDMGFATGLLLLPLVILLFPDGRLGRSWRWPLRVIRVAFAVYLVGHVCISAVALGRQTPVWTGGGVIGARHPSSFAAWFGVAQPILLAVFVAGCFASVGRQVVSYRRSSGARRQQVKWLASGGVGCIAGLLFVAAGAAKTAPGAVWILILLAWMALPFSIGVGILKYRLYEIDRLISRTLSYAILTALLAGTFIGLVALTTDTLALSGRVGVAASTLAAAALFNPLRKRTQRLVDRRFNRARYDAEATVAAFTARLRDAVEIDVIRADLLDAVNRAVQPTHASIWIKP
jgi:hypothetical protein